MTNAEKFALFGIGLLLLLRSRAQAATSQIKGPFLRTSSGDIRRENDASRLVAPTNDLAFYYVPPPVGFSQPVAPQTTDNSGSTTAKVPTTSQPPIIPPGAFDFPYTPDSCGFFCLPPGGIVVVDPPPPPPVEPSPASQSGQPSQPDPPYIDPNPGPFVEDFQMVN